MKVCCELHMAYYIVCCFKTSPHIKNTQRSFYIWFNAQINPEPLASFSAAKKKYAANVNINVRFCIFNNFWDCYSATLIHKYKHCDGLRFTRRIDGVCYELQCLKQVPVLSSGSRCTQTFQSCCCYWLKACCSVKIAGDEHSQAVVSTRCTFDFGKYNKELMLISKLKIKIAQESFSLAIFLPTLKLMDAAVFHHAQHIHVCQRLQFNSTSFKGIIWIFIKIIMEKAVVK